MLEAATGGDPGRLREAVARRGVTVLEVVPAVLQLLLEADEAAGDPALGGLRWLVVTGEALPPALCRAWLQRYPEIPLVNAYGPTECADDVTHHVVRTPPAAAAVRVPIGRPIAHVQMHVLDDALQPVAPGAVGELCVSGVAVGRGYLHDAARTAAAFVAPDPRTGWPGTRLYRTGDRGRALSDGTFEWLGRCDQQVKIRGMRVEPEEVEAVLRQHPAVRQAAVVPRPVPSGGLKLVAYVAASTTGAGLVEVLRRYLGERLPDSMIPSSFEMLAALPLAANGKIDRQALAAPSISDEPRPAFAGVPTSPLEGLLADIWSEVLGVAVRSVEDNFFALGGDSLSTIRVAARARCHGLVLTPQQIFEHQTIAGMAAVATTSPEVPADQGLVTGEVELTPIQRMLITADLPELHHYNMAMLLEVEDQLRPSWLAIAVEHLMRHHDALRLRLRREGAEWRQTIVGLDGAVPFSHLDLSALPDAEVGPAIERLSAEQQTTLRLADGPLLRVVFFDLGRDRPGRLLVVVHHLACDVVSWPILLEDLAGVYAQLRCGDAIALPAKTTSFQVWARRLAEWGCMPERREDLCFWQRECADPGARLPCADGHGEAAIADLDRVRLVLGRDETVATLGASAALGVSVEAVLLTGLVTAVTEVAGGDAILVYLERHGREALLPGLDVSRTVGWFTAVFPVRVGVAPSRRPPETLLIVDRHLRAIPDGGVGYGVARCALDDAAAAASSRALQRPEISFNYLGRLDPPDGARWRIARESAGREVGLHGTRPTLLDVTAHVANGLLVVAWDYDTRRYQRGMIEQLALRVRTIVCDLTAASGCEPGPSAAEARTP